MAFIWSILGALLTVYVVMMIISVVLAIIPILFYGSIFGFAALFIYTVLSDKK